MKKTISICLIISTIFLLCACGGSNSANETSQEQTSAINSQNDIETQNEVETQSNIETQNTIPSETPKPEPEYQIINFGDTINLDFAEITIDGFGSGDGITVEEDDRTSYFNKGHYTAYLSGTIKNLHTTYIDPSASNSYVTMIFDDKYTYTGSIYAMSSSWDGVAALETCNFYVYAEVSEEIIETFSTVKITFGFTENFESPEIYMFKDFEKCDYIYELNASK